MGVRKGKGKGRWTERWGGERVAIDIARELLVMRVEWSLDIVFLDFCRVESRESSVVVIVFCPSVSGTCTRLDSLLD